jgi:hypothetical protein
LAVVVRGVAVVFLLLLTAFAGALGAHASSSSADLAISVTGPTQLEQFTEGSYRIAYVNNGPATATNATVTVTLDAFLSWDAFYSTGNCTSVTQGTSKQDVFVCTLGDLQPGASGSFSFAIRVPDSTPTGTYKATFTVASDQPDTKQQNNTSVYHIAVVTPFHADVQTEFLQQPFTPQPFFPGESVTIGTQYANNGPAVATNVVETFTLPASFGFDPSNSDSRCSANAQTVTCTLGTTGVDTGTNMLDISFFVGHDGTYTVTGTIAADQPDPVPANNTGSVTIAVTG